MLKSDIEILKAVADNNQESFRLLYDKYELMVYNLAFSYSKSRAEAEDLTQEVFVKIYKNAKTFKNKSSVSTWIYRITVNAAIDKLKKIKRHRVEDITDSENNIAAKLHPGILLEYKERATYLYAAIDLLPENQKTAFVHSFIEGIPRKEVADIMGLGLKAIESLLQRAKGNMRRSLGDIYDKL